MLNDCNSSECPANSRKLLDRISDIERDIQQLRAEREEDNRMLAAERHKMKDILHGLSVTLTKLVMMLEGSMGSTGLIGSQQETDRRLDGLEKWQVEIRTSNRWMLAFAGLLGGGAGPVVSFMITYLTEK